MAHEHLASYSQQTVYLPAGIGDFFLVCLKKYCGGKISSKSEFEENFVPIRVSIASKLHFCSGKSSTRASTHSDCCYIDPIAGAQPPFTQRLQELVALEGETIKYERQRRLGRRRIKFE